MVCDARYAAGACLNALRRLRPPRLLGRVAFSHDQSETGLPMMDSRVWRMAVSNSKQEWERWLGGQAYSTKETLGSARQERKRVVFSCA